MCRGERRSVALFLDLGGLAHPVAQVIELRSPHVAAGHALDLGHDGRVHGEGALDADPEADLPDGERLAAAAALAADDDRPGTPGCARECLRPRGRAPSGCRRGRTRGCRPAAGYGRRDRWNSQRKLRSRGAHANQGPRRRGTRAADLPPPGSAGGRRGGRVGGRACAAAPGPAAIARAGRGRR